MMAAMVELSSNELLVTPNALELLEASKHLPEDVRPTDLFGAKILHKLVEVPLFVLLMFLNNIPMYINEDLCLGALHPLLLVAGVELTAVDAPIQHIVLLLKEVL